MLVATSTSTAPAGLQYILPVWCTSYPSGHTGCTLSPSLHQDPMMGMQRMSSADPLLNPFIPCAARISGVYRRSPDLVSYLVFAAVFRNSSFLPDDLHRFMDLVVFPCSLQLCTCLLVTFQGTSYPIWLLQLFWFSRFTEAFVAIFKSSDVTTTSDYLRWASLSQQANELEDLGIFFCLSLILSLFYG